MVHSSLPAFAIFLGVNVFWAIASHIIYSFAKTSWLVARMRVAGGKETLFLKKLHKILMRTTSVISLPMLCASLVGPSGDIEILSWLWGVFGCLFSISLVTMILSCKWIISRVSLSILYILPLYRWSLSHLYWIFVKFSLTVWRSRSFSLKEWEMISLPQRCVWIWRRADNWISL